MSLTYSPSLRRSSVLALTLVGLLTGSAFAHAGPAQCEALLTGEDVNTLAPAVRGAAADAAESLKATADEVALKKGAVDENEIKKSVSRKIKDKVESAVKTLKGGCLRGNPIALKNFGKTLGTVWTFQVVGFVLATQGRSDEEKAEHPVDFPFAVLANTAFMIWVQSEMNCASTPPTSGGAPAKSFKDLMHTYVYGESPNFGAATREYLGNVKNRYSSYMVTLPLGIISFTIIQAIEDEIRKKIEGKDSKRPDFLSKDHMQSVLSDAIFNTAFNTVWLFPRWALATTPLEAKLIPMFRSFAKTKGTAASLGSLGAEWGYRVSMGLLDNWVFFKTRKNGLEIKGFVSFNPNKMAEKIINHGKNAEPAPQPKVTEVKNIEDAQRMMREQTP